MQQLGEFRGSVATDKTGDALARRVLPMVRRTARRFRDGVIPKKLRRCLEQTMRGKWRAPARLGRGMVIENQTLGPLIIR